MTKREYITRQPKSKLAAELEANTWSDNQPITVIGGLLAPHNKCSNLYKALQSATLQEYCVGGHRWRGTEGWWIAVA